MSAHTTLTAGTSKIPTSDATLVKYGLSEDSRAETEFPVQDRRINNTVKQKMNLFIIFKPRRNAILETLTNEKRQGNMGLDRISPASLFKLSMRLRAKFVPVPLFPDFLCPIMLGTLKPLYENYNLNRLQEDF
jgi:hypothetical protein